MKAAIKNKPKYKLKKYYTGTGDLKTEYEDLNSSNTAGMQKSQAVADGLGSIPVIGAFKSVGEGVGNMVAQRDDYGIAKSTTGAAVGSVFNPLAQTTDLIKGKGGFKGMVGNALIIGGAIEKEKELKALKKAAENRVNLYNRDMAQRNVDVDQIGYAEKGLDLSKYPDGTDGIKPKVKSTTPTVKDNIQLYPSKLSQTDDAKAYYKNVQPIAYKTVKSEPGTGNMFNGKGKGAYDQVRLEKDPNSPNFGKEVKNNTCVGYACHIAEEAGAKEDKSTYNPFFTRDHEKLGWMRIPIDSASTGDRIQYWDKDNTGGNKIKDVGNNTYIKDKYPKHMGVYMSKAADGQVYDYEDGDSQKTAKVAKRAINNDNATVYRYVGTPETQKRYTSTTTQKQPQSTNNVAMNTKKLYSQGTSKIQGNYKKVKPIEVEGDEILMEKSKGKYKMKADFKGGPSHESGGIPIIAEEGDIIYPANKRDQVVKAYNENNHSKLESIRKTLPTDTNYKYKKGVKSLDGPYTKLDLGGDGAGDGTTVSALQGLTTPKSKGISDSKNKTYSKMKGKTDWGKIGATAMEFAPIAYNIGKGLFGKSEKTNRRLYNPDEFQYTDISQPIRNEAANAYTAEKDQIRNSAGGSSSMYLANQSLANSRKYQRLQEINNNEGGRKVAVANMNTELKNNSKMTNLNLQNQYDELDLRNDAAKKKYLSDGFSQLSQASQNRQRMRNMADADDIRARTLKDMVANYGFDPNVLKDKDKELYNFKTFSKGTKGVKGKYKMKSGCGCKGDCGC